MRDDWKLHKIEDTKNRDCEYGFDRFNLKGI